MSFYNMNSTFLKQQKDITVSSPQFVPWGYDQDIKDPHLYHPELRSLAILEKVCKYIYIGATYGSSAEWLSHHTKRKITKEGIRVLYEKWLKCKALKGQETLKETRIKKKREMEARLERLNRKNNGEGGTTVEETVEKPEAETA